MFRRFTVGYLTKIVKTFKGKELPVYITEVSLYNDKKHAEIVNVNRDKNKTATGQNYVQNFVSHFCHIGQ
jgi:hypothetical protein